MLSKIRLFENGSLRPDFHRNLGTNADAWCSQYLRVSYTAVKERVLAGAADDEALEWCFENGRPLDELDLRVWNAFISKLGWNDAATSRLHDYKVQAGFGNRDDLQTIVQFMDVDEGRKP